MKGKFLFFVFLEENGDKGKRSTTQQVVSVACGPCAALSVQFSYFYDVWIPNTSFLFTSPWCYRADTHQMFVFAVQHTDPSKPRTTLLFMGLFWSAHFTASQSVSLFPYKFTFAAKYERQNYFSHISDWLWHTAQGMCWTPNMFSWCWQALWSPDRLIVFQRITPTPNNSALALVFVCLTFTLTLSPSVRAKRNDFSGASFPNLLLDCVQQDVLPYLSRLHNIPFRFCMVVLFLNSWDYSRIHSIIH